MGKALRRNLEDDNISLIRNNCGNRNAPSKYLNISFYVKNLFFLALKQLTAVANNADDSIISDYLNAGGSALEVILVIDKLESKIYYQYQPIFSVLYLIITK